MLGNEEEYRPPWRGWHVIGRFLPMVVLGIVFIIIGRSADVPHRGAESFGVIFVWMGIILIGAAVVGMLTTKCPVCFRTHWVACVQEPDYVRTEEEDGYYRELSVPKEEP